MAPRRPVQLEAWRGTGGRPPEFVGRRVKPSHPIWGRHHRRALPFGGVAACGGSGSRPGRKGPRLCAANVPSSRCTRCIRPAGRSVDTGASGRGGNVLRTRAARTSLGACVSPPGGHRGNDRMVRVGLHPAEIDLSGCVSNPRRSAPRCGVPRGYQHLCVLSALAAPSAARTRSPGRPKLMRTPAGCSSCGGVRLRSGLLGHAWNGRAPVRASTSASACLLQRWTAEAEGLVRAPADNRVPFQKVLSEPAAPRIAGWAHGIESQ